MKFRLFFLALSLLNGCASDSNPDPRGGEINYAVRNESLAWVKACAAKTSPTKIINIDTRSLDLCRKPNFFHGSRVRVRLSVQGAQLGIDFKIHFTMLPSAISGPRAAELLSQARACAPELQGLWARYGVRMNIPIDSDRDPDPEGNDLPRQEVNLIDSPGISNAGNFFYRPERFCQMMAHEIGHQLGLPDEYSEPDCPDRAFVSTEMHPFSIMAFTDASFDDLDFYPRHVRSVFAEFCGEAAPPRAILPREWINLGYPQ